MNAISNHSRSLFKIERNWMLRGIAQLSCGESRRKFCSHSSWSAVEFLKDEIQNINGRNIIKTVLYPPNTKNQLVFTLDGVFTQKECQNWIDITEDKGYEPALVNIGQGKQVSLTDIRNSSRCIIDSTEMAEKLMTFVRPFLPSIWKGRKLSCLNERLRFLKYDPGERFKAHFDGSYVRPDKSEISQITVQLYLNEGFTGGQTTFVHKTQSHVACNPKIGRVLIFEHKTFHEGSPVTQGTKYSCRTDVMYHNK